MVKFRCIYIIYVPLHFCRRQGDLNPRVRQGEAQAHVRLPPSSSDRRQSLCIDYSPSKSTLMYRLESELIRLPLTTILMELLLQNTFSIGGGFPT